MPNTVLILGPTGRFGRHTADAFAARGWLVRRFDRKTDRLTTAAKGVDVIIAGWNPPYQEWAAQLPALHAQIRRAALDNDATVILPGNVYVFGPKAPGPWAADTPHLATNPLGRIRQNLESAYRRDGVKTILLRAGDFLDTQPSGNWFDRMMAKSLPRGRLSYPGHTDRDHAWAYLPDFARLEVGREVAGADGKPTVETTPATHKMTVRDLLRHTSGLTYGVFGKSAIKSRYLAAGTHLWTDTNEQYAARLAKLPLVAEPGTLWEYGRSTDLLGRVLEVAAGKPLDEVVAGLVLKPLGMTETFFHVPEALRSRVAAADPEAAFGNKPPELLDPARPDTFLSGGGGMYGSTRDYLRFLRMILNGGELEGTRILSPASVRLMTADHLTPEIDTGGLAPLGYGFGLGFAVRRGEDGAWPGSTGDLYWGGYAGTYFWIDPREKLLVVYMMQSVSQREPYRLIVRQGVYGAMTR